MKLIPNLADIDRKATQQAGISPEILMESAGTQVALAVQAHCQAGQQGVILCGPGNNGGDGFVCARKLYQAGFHQLSVVYTSNAYKNEALANFEKILIDLPITVINAREQPDLACQRLQQADFVVDALFGSGLARPIANREAELIAACNVARTSQKATWVLAVDLPSGIEGRSGKILGAAIQADATVTFAAAKPGLYIHPGKAHAGQVSIVDIGIPPRLIEEEESPFRLITQAQARQWIPPRQLDSHKYTYGHVLVISGSKTMPGAAALCSEAAMSCGAGLVTLAAPEAVFSQITLMPEIMRHPLPDNATLGSASLDDILHLLTQKRFNAVVLGPGLGSEPDTQHAILALLKALKEQSLPVVVDADGLNALSQTPQALSSHFILTPHLGECARLLQQENSAILTDRLTAAQQVQERYQANVVLKSASNLVMIGATPLEGNLCWISPLGNPGMATAGSGDVLSGMLGALAAQRHAQGLPVAPAVPLAVYLHGLAGDLAAEALTPYAMRASDITRHLPQAFQRILS